MLHRKTFLEMTTSLYLFLFSIGMTQVLSRHHHRTNDWRLPDGLSPTYYTIKIKTRIGSFVNGTESSYYFDGHVDIDFTVKLANLNSIVINGHMIDIISSELRKKDDSEPIKLQNHTPQPDNFQKLYFVLESGTLEGEKEYVLSINYKGYNKDNLEGFFRSSYIDSNGHFRYLLATQFEPIYARRAFPCFDEPAYKSYFKISVSISKEPKWYYVLTNTQQDGDAIPDPDDSNYQMYTFKRTPIHISTYVVAFAVVNYRHTDTKNFVADYGVSTGSKPFVTYGTQQHIEAGDGEVSQNIGAEFMEYFTGKIGNGFPFYKIDQITINDMKIDGMENWGLVVYRSNRLLIARDTTGLRLVMTVGLIAHELAHQWFGNLVSVKWWDSVWLNEALPTYLQYLIPPEMKHNSYNLSDIAFMGIFHALEIATGCFRDDAQIKAIAMNTQVNTPQEIDDAFGTVSYSKAAGVMRMFHHVFGNDIFFKALQTYIDRLKEHSAVPKDFTDELQIAYDAASVKPNLGGKPVAEIFANWMNRPGYPMVNATRIDNTTIRLSQMRFYSVLNGTYDTEWYIPISMVTNKNLDFDTKVQYWLVPGQNLTITIDADVRWFIINNQATGFFRVLYDRSNYGNLIPFITDENTFTQINPFNRGQICDDIFSITKSAAGNYLDVNVTYSLVPYLNLEYETGPNFIAYSHARTNSKLLVSHPEAQTRYQNIILREWIKKYHRVSFKSHQRSSKYNKNRDLVVSLACEFGLQECVFKCDKMFERQFSSTSKRHEIPDDLKEAVYCSAIRNGNIDRWNRLWERYRQRLSYSERDQIINALGCSKNKEIITKYLQKTLDDNSGLLKSDRELAFKAVYNGNAENAPIAVQFLANSFNIIVQKFKRKSVKNIIQDLSSHLTTDDDIYHLMRIKSHIKARKSNPDIKSLLTSAESGIDLVRSNMIWIERSIMY